MRKMTVTWQESRRWIAWGAKRQPPEQSPQMLTSNGIHTRNNANGRRRLLILSLIGALIVPLCVMAAAAGANPASGSQTECWATTAPPPAGFYVAAIVAPARAPGCAGHYGWKLEAAAAGVAECWVVSAPPTGFYIAAILSTSASCPHHYRWKLDAAATASPSPSSTSGPS
jgi:hypothetical protein